MFEGSNSGGRSSLHVRKSIPDPFCGCWFSYTVISPLRSCVEIPNLKSRRKILLLSLCVSYANILLYYLSSIYLMVLGDYFFVNFLLLLYRLTQGSRVEHQTLTTLMQFRYYEQKYSVFLTMSAVMSHEIETLTLSPLLLLGNNM